MVIDDDPRIERWLLNALGYEWFCDLRKTIGTFDEDGNVLAGMAFLSFTGWDVELALAAARPGVIGRQFLQRAGEVVFDELGCGRCTVQTANPHVVKLFLGLGGHVEGLKKEAMGPGKDAWMLGLLWENWRFGGPEHG